MNDDLSAFVIPSDLCHALRNARRVVALTGAGISAESGVPTFRDGMTGLWAQYNPQGLATPQAFARNPQLVWEWYAWRRELVSQVQPNAGHRALAELERRVPHFTLITQDVDGLHQRAGSQRVIEIHGNITRVKCFDEGTVVEQWEETGDVPPHCPNCGGLLRPDVVWFGESHSRVLRVGDCRTGPHARSGAQQSFWAYQLHSWNVTTGDLRQVTFKPEGVRQGVISPDFSRGILYALQFSIAPTLRSNPLGLPGAFVFALVCLDRRMVLVAGQRA